MPPIITHGNNITNKMLLMIKKKSQMTNELESKETENMAEFTYVGTGMKVWREIHKDLLANC